MEKISSPREWRKWSLGLGQHLKGASPNMRTDSVRMYYVTPYFTLAGKYKTQP